MLNETDLNQKQRIKGLEREIERLREGIQQELDHTESDERLGYPPASYQINAPLAFIQTYLETKRDTLRWVLDMFSEKEATE